MTRIVAVDDDSRQLSSLKRILRHSGYALETHTNPRIALRAVLKDRPDLVLLDVSMPAMSGHEFLRRIRKAFGATGRGLERPAQFCPPVIFLTALGSPRQRVSGLDAGAVDYLSKPVDADELRARIRAHLHRAEEAKEALGQIDRERSAIETAIAAMLGDLRTCQGLLGDLGQAMEMNRFVRRQALPTELVERARKSLHGAATALAATIDRPGIDVQDPFHD